MRHVETIIEGDGWRAEHAPERQYPFLLAFGTGGERVFLDGVAFGALREKDALVESVRRHDFLEGDGHSVETKSVAPFGVEPAIRRKFDYYLNTIRVTTDVGVKAAAPIDGFNIDDLRLSGDWARFAVIADGGENGALPDELAWSEIAAAPFALWESETTFAAILLETRDGRRLEIGAGFDLWRWNTASSVDGAKGRFSLTRNENGELLLKRSVLAFEVETEIPSREWRFTWYLAWSLSPNAERPAAASGFNIAPFPQIGENPPFPKEGGKVLALSLADVVWPPSARISRNAELAEAPCLHSKTVRNHLRKTVRKIAAAPMAEAIETIVFIGMEPRFCDSAAHLERSKLDALAHWDVSDIITFHFWASRQLRSKEIDIELIPGENRNACELPSMRTLARPRQTP